MNTARHVPSDGTDLTLRAVGPATDDGRLPLSELARLAGGLQASLERIALSISGSLTRPGRRPREIVDAVRMDFVGFEHGSAILNIARTGQLSIDNLLENSLDALELGVRKILEGSATLPPHFTPQVINGIRDLTGGISPSNITRIDFHRGGEIRFTIDDRLQNAVRQAKFEPVHQMATVVGRLHMGDFSPAGLRCRIDTYAGSVLCDFALDLRDAVLDAMDEMVVAEGKAELDPNGSSVHMLHLSRLESLPGTRPRSLDNLARQQNVEPVSSLAELGGEPIDDFDNFLADVKSARLGDI